MVISATLSKILTTGGRLYYDNGANTMVTTSLGFVRAGTVPFDNKISEDEKAQAITWSVSSALLSLGVQATVYKLLNPILSKTSIRNLNLDKKFNEKNIKNLQEFEKHLPIEELEKIIDDSTDDNVVNNIRKGIEKSIDEVHGAQPKSKKIPRVKYHGEQLDAKQLTNKVVGQFSDFVKEAGKDSKFTKKAAKESLEMLKKYKGGTQFLTFVFGVALFTGYLIPSFICKNLRVVLDKVQAKKELKQGKVSIPNQKQEANETTNKAASKESEKKPEKKRSLFKYFGLPMIAASSALFLLSKPERIGKVFGNKAKESVQKGFTKLASWDHNLNPSDRVSRNIVTNLILRPASALLQGKPFLAAYSFVMEGLSGLALRGSEKLLGSNKNYRGLFKLAADKMKIRENPSLRRGLDFFMKHLIQTYLILGVGMGLATNRLSKPLSEFIKKVTKADEQKENTDYMQKIFYTVPNTSITEFARGSFNGQSNLITSYINSKKLATDAQ